MSPTPEDDDAELEAILDAKDRARAAAAAEAAKAGPIAKLTGAKDASAKDAKKPAKEETPRVAAADGDDSTTGADAKKKKDEPSDEELGWIGLRWRGLKRHFTHRPDPLTSLVFVLPVFLAYSFAVLAIDARVGVDFLSRLVLEQLLRNTAAYVGVHLGVAAVLGGLVWFLRRKGKIEPARFLPALIESVVWAVLLALIVHVALVRLLPPEAVPGAVRRAADGAAQARPATAAAPAELSAFARCVLALGAGFYEEVVFRAAVVGTLAWALPRYASVSPRLTAVIAIVISTVLFVVYAWVVGGAADHTLRAVIASAMVGLVLGVVYRFRGFAVAVYTHAFFGLAGVVAWALAR